MISHQCSRLSKLQRLLLQIGIGLATVFVYVSPYLILGQDTPTLINDNLDQGPIQFWRLYHESNPFWNSAAASPRFLNGELPAQAGPNLQWANLPYFLLSPFAAYVSLQLLTRVVAFVGMWLLLRALFHKGEEQIICNLVFIGVAILFSILPHYPPTSFCVPSLPLHVWAFWKIARREDKWWHWVTLCLIPFFTSFLVAQVFLLILVGAVWIIASVIQQRVNWRWLGAVALVSVLYCVCEYDLILFVMTSQVISHRIEFKTVSVSLNTGLRNALSNFCEGNYFVATYHYFLILLFPLTACTAIFDWGRSILGRLCVGRGSNDKNAPDTHQTECHYYMRISVGAFLLAGIISLWYGLYNWVPVVSLRQSMPVLNMVQWDRLHWLHPLVWYVGLASLLLSWAKMLRPRNRVAFVIFVLMWQGIFLFLHADHTKSLFANMLTWREFYATKQFEEIQEFISKPAKNYRVASLGLHPAIALYNGFYCLDGYCTNYSLNYKKRFRQVIAMELAKSDELKDYFDNWGSRCYLLSSEVGLNFISTKQKPKSISRLSLDLDAFVKLGGEYILSAVHIDNPEKSGLELMKVFDDPQSAWRIWLYAPLKASE